MKFGQALSVFEAALPEEVAAPYRAALTKLQEAAPPLPAATVHAVLAARARAGLAGRCSAASTTARPPPPASARCTGRSGPTAATSRSRSSTRARARRCSSDLNQLSRLAPHVRGALARARRQAAARRAARRGSPRSSTTASRPSPSATFAAAYDGDPEIAVPDVVDRHRAGARDRVDRRHAAVEDHRRRHARAARPRPLLLARFLFSGPARAGLLHADPHPGNFRLLPDGRLGVLDFGAVNRLPDGAPEPIGRLARLGARRRRRGGARRPARRGLRQGRRRGRRRGAAELPAAAARARRRSRPFRFTRAWLRAQALRIGDPRSPAAALGRQLNLPPSYLLIHRVTLGTIGVLCQLDGEAAFRAEMERWQPGFAAPAHPAA